MTSILSINSQFGDNIEILSIEQGSEAWHKLRSEHIGASEAASIMDVDPWISRYQRWQQKIGLLPPQEETEAMRRGKELEPVAREEFYNQTGIQTWPVVIKNIKYPYLLASMDGVQLSMLGYVQYAVEIKVPGKKTHEMAMNDIIPEHYQWQLLHQMIVCDLQTIFYFSWNETSSKILEFSRDPDMEKRYLEQAEEFWKSVQDPVGKPIEPGDSDYLDMEGDKEWEHKSYCWMHAKQRKEEAIKDEEECRKILIELSKNQCAQGNGVRLTKYVSRGRIDYGAIEELRGVNLEQYRKPNTVAWRIS